jgi:hypothetical protein
MNSMFSDETVNKSERRAFPQWRVELAYIAQDGVCARCGNTLELGFHRHHKDGNPANNSLENLELLCPECHRATLGEAYKRHREQEERALSYLNKLLDECFNGRLSGATVERLVDAITLSLKISRSLNKLDEGIESPPPTIALLKKLQETRILQETYLEGFKEGVKWMAERLKVVEQSAKNQ